MTDFHITIIHTFYYGIECKGQSLSTVIVSQKLQFSILFKARVNSHFLNKHRL